MKSIRLETRRRWNWKVFLVLMGLIIPAAFAILPFEFSRQQAYGGGDLIASLGWETLLVDRLINILLAALLGGIGLVLAARSGTGMPFVESWLKREPMPCRFSRVVAMAWITGVALVLSSLLLKSMVFDPPLNAMVKELGIVVPAGAAASPLFGLLAAFSAGITEETLFRLFGLSLLAWLGGLIFHDRDGRPSAAVFWTANMVFALGFAAAHLPTATALGLPMNALVISSTLVLNALGGLAFGWLFWTFGLESAMLAHFFADVILYTLVPLITMQDVEAARIAATASVLTAVLLGVVWSFVSLGAERRWRHPQMGN